MDKKYARFVLQSYLAGKSADNDAQMAGALSEAARDPGLAAWLEDECAFDDALRERLRAVEPPSALKAAVLAATPASLPAPPPRRSFPLAWAAALAVLATVAAVWFWPRGATADFAGFRSEMLRVTLGRVQFNFSSGDARELERWLGQRAGVGTVALPEGLKSLSGLGCRELKWQGRSVGLICLQTRGGGALHVFALRCDTMPGAPTEGQTRFAASDGIQTAVWRHGGVIYLAALKGDNTVLRQALELRSL